MGEHERMTWAELATENLRAARTLMREGHFRISATRSYYAAYDAVTYVLLERGPHLVFKHGRNNPPHEKLGTFVDKNLGLRWDDRRQLGPLVSTLLALRIDAEYHPEEEIDDEGARNAIRDAENALVILGVDIM